jgi:orotidine-5'-phosphate decarboxylase
MITLENLFEQIRNKKSFLCIGLDTDFDKIPKFLHDFEYPIFEFNKNIIDSTADVAVAYKPNTAFYESLGAAGWISLEMTIDYLKKNHPDIFVIADAKRGDIGNTSTMYAKAFFETMSFDAITVAPYMGEDSVSPFLSYEGKWVILLALTSNKGANDFQFIYDHDEKLKLFEKVILRSQTWGNANNMMYVVGATKAEMLKDVRKLAPDHFLLVPGIGAQGGNLADVARNGMNNKCGLLVNSSREIIYADNTNKFGDAARQKAINIQAEMRKLLSEKRLV